MNNIEMIKNLAARNKVINSADVLYLIAQLEAAQKLAQHYLEQRDAAEQVSASALRDWAKEGQRAEKAEAELSAANEKLAQPVVLSSSTVMSRACAVRAIKAAGFTVEGGE